MTAATDAASDAATGLATGGGAADGAPEHTTERAPDRAPPPPPRARDLAAAFLRRDVATAWSYRLPFAMDTLSVAFALVLFFFLARLVDRADVSDLGGLERGYFPFVVLGMALLYVVGAALRSFTAKLRTEQTTGTLEVLLATPVPSPLLILASALYDLLRATGMALLMVLLATALGLRFEVTAVSAVGVAVALVALVVSFAALGVLVAAFTVVFKQAGGLVGLVTSAIALLGGVWFPVELLPAPLRWLADALPFTWGVDVLRAGLLTGHLPAARLALLVGFAAVALPIALVVLRAAVDRARRTGTLAQY